MSSNVTEVMYEYIKQLDITSVCYEAIRQFYKTKGVKDTPVHWENASAYTRAAMVKLVDDRKKIAELETITFEQAHNKLIDSRKKAGWTYGSEYDIEKQTDPYLCTYDELSKNFKMADAIIYALIKVLTDPALQLEQDKETV